MFHFNIVYAYEKHIMCIYLDLTLESFPKEFEESKVLYWYGVDNENRKICEFKFVHFLFEFVHLLFLIF